MTTLPDPPVPADADLTGFHYMPLDVLRLRDSGIASEATGDEFRAAILLWCASWHQKPAGSLPTKETELANFAGYGRVVKEWKKVAQGALRGWVVCSDGRMYHPVIAEKANEAWLEKRLHSWAKECDRIRKANKERKENGLDPLEIPPKPEKIPPENGAISTGITPETPPPYGGIPAENALKGKVREKKGKEIINTAAASETVTRPPDPENPPDAALDINFVMDILGRIGLPQSHAVNETATPARWRAAGYTRAEILAASDVVSARRTNVSTLKYLDSVVEALREAAKPISINGKAAPVAPRDRSQAEIWEARIKLWRDRACKTWVDENWGPAPGQPGCKVPKHLIPEFDQGAA